MREILHYVNDHQTIPESIMEDDNVAGREKCIVLDVFNLLFPLISDSRPPPRLHCPPGTSARQKLAAVVHHPQPSQQLVTTDPTDTKFLVAEESQSHSQAASPSHHRSRIGDTTARSERALG